MSGSGWRCDIDGCGARFDRVEAALVHQVTEHARHECGVCGEAVPEGYFAIRHAFESHSRAEYVRAYGADAAAVRDRERVRREVEANVDLETVLDRIRNGG